MTNCTTTRGPALIRKFTILLFLSLTMGISHAQDWRLADGEMKVRRGLIARGDEQGVQARLARCALGCSDAPLARRASEGALAGASG